MVFCALVVGKGFSVLFSWPDRLCLQPLQSFLGPHLYPLLIFLSCYLPIIIFLTASSLSPGSPPHPYPNFIFFNLVGKFISIFPRYPQSLFQTHHFLHSSILPSNIFFLQSNFDTRACTKAWQSLSYLFFMQKFYLLCFHPLIFLSFLKLKSAFSLSFLPLRGASTTTHCQLSPSFIFLSFPDQASFPFFLWELHPTTGRANQLPPSFYLFIFSLYPLFLWEVHPPPLTSLSTFSDLNPASVTFYRVLFSHFCCQCVFISHNLETVAHCDVLLRCQFFQVKSQLPPLLDPLKFHFEWNRVASFKFRN